MTFFFSYHSMNITQLLLEKKVIVKTYPHQNMYLYILFLKLLLNLNPNNYKARSFMNN